VSIGKPEIGRQLMQRLDVTDGGKDWFFCDPDSALYDALGLNSGIGTFVAPETAYTFRDRIFRMNERTDGLKDLFSVLAKWKDAVYLPPKQQQAFQQGGTFIFKGFDTLYAHYDASTGAHVQVDKAVQLALAATRD